MPGLSLICNFREDLRQKENRILQALDSTVHFRHYKRKILLHEQAYFLGCTVYDGYPVALYESEAFLIYLEGRVYGEDESALGRQLVNLAQSISQNVDREGRNINKWLMNADGDFIIFLFHRKLPEMYIINDVFSRLPLYYYSTNEQFLISRDIEFISLFIKNKEFDKMGIAQYLLFSYPLGKRTLLRNVFRLAPASLIKIDLNRAQIEMEDMHDFNFDEKIHSEKSVKENADNLVDLLSNSCRNRDNSGNGYKNILSLSGGLDSRSVGACLQRSNIHFSGVTFLDFNRTAKLDLEIARQVANIFRIEWNIFELSPPRGKDILQLLRMKSSSNCLSMSFILPFFEKIKEIYNQKITFFTGDGGDKLFPDLRPERKLHNIEDLVNYIIQYNQVFSIERVAALTGIRKKEIIDEVRERLLFYPEKELSQKYVHFIFYERGFKWLFEGEDRNRLGCLNRPISLDRFLDLSDLLEIQ